MKQKTIYYITIVIILFTGFIPGFVGRVILGVSCFLAGTSSVRMKIKQALDNNKKVMRI